MRLGKSWLFSPGIYAKPLRGEGALLLRSKQKWNSKAPVASVTSNRARTMEDLRTRIEFLVTHQYEDGFKQATDIQVLTDKILDAVEKFLDSKANT